MGVNSFPAPLPSVTALLALLLVLLRLSFISTQSISGPTFCNINSQSSVLSLLRGRLPKDVDLVLAQMIFEMSLVAESQDEPENACHPLVIFGRARELVKSHPTIATANARSRAS
jgi:hypothetical protein